MHHIIYGSRAVTPFSDGDLLTLLLQARSHNQLHDISGALVYSKGQFMQVIEGEEEALAVLYERLLRDPRHAQLVKYAEKAIAERSFGEWSMAFQPVSETQFAGLIGYVPAGSFASTAPDLGRADGLLLGLMKELVAPPLA
ncbi:MAG: BLUF domain-containing protein [Janthinobacterium lividum]